MQGNKEENKGPQVVSKNNLDFVEIAFPEEYSFDFEESLPESYDLRNGKNEVDPKYQINRATRDARSGRIEPIYTEKAVVCKHWLRGLCKKGDLCEFLHEYNLERIPECWFYTKYGECSNPECLYLHLEQGSNVKYCAFYDKGFCEKGPECKERHLKRAICIMYKEGFCPNGPKCNHYHPKCIQVGPVVPEKQKNNYLNLFLQSKPQKNFHPKMDPLLSNSKNNSGNLIQAIDDNRGKVYRPLGSVTCFKCGMKGHYANRC